MASLYNLGRNGVVEVKAMQNPPQGDFGARAMQAGPAAALNTVLPADG